MAVSSPLSTEPVAHTDQQEIARQVMAASTSFYWAMRMLPADRRAAIFAVYAFCRTVDDIADDEPDRQKRQSGLAGPGKAGDENQ